MKELNLIDFKELDNNMGFENIVMAGELLFASKITDRKQVDELKKLGVENAIDLKQPGETDFDDQGEFESVGINYINFPISQISELDFDRVEEFSKILTKLQGKTIIYCMSANRVGALFALYAFLICGHPRSRSIDFGRRVGMSREQLVDTVSQHLQKLSA